LPACQLAILSRTDRTKNYQLTSPTNEKYMPMKYLPACQSTLLSRTDRTKNYQLTSPTNGKYVPMKYLPACQLAILSVPMEQKTTKYKVFSFVFPL
jgi:hypothetical protein